MYVNHSTMTSFLEPEGEPLREMGWQELKPLLIRWTKVRRKWDSNP